MCIFALDLNIIEYEYKQEIAKAQKEKLAGFYFDLAKLVFGAMVIGDITPYLIGTSESVNFLVLLGGGVSVILLAGLGNRIFKI